MPTFGSLALGACLSVIAGLDRTAVFQVMLSRPLVIAPVTGLLLGVPWLGLELGALLELIWISRMPVGAVIPPDDTQIAVGGTLLASILVPDWDLPPTTLPPLILLIAMPLGKLGQLFERWARGANDRLMVRAHAAVHEDSPPFESLHWRGALHFSLSSLATFTVIVTGGLIILPILLPLLHDPMHISAPWFRLLFILVGGAVLLRTLHVGKALSLFTCSFLLGLAVLWLIRS